VPKQVGEYYARSHQNDDSRQLVENAGLRTIEDDCMAQDHSSYRSGLATYSLFNNCH
jgi:predicted CoA-binding protein